MHIWQDTLVGAYCLCACREPYGTFSFLHLLLSLFCLFTRALYRMYYWLVCPGWLAFFLGVRSAAIFDAVVAIVWLSLLISNLFNRGLEEIFNSYKVQIYLIAPKFCVSCFRDSGAETTLEPLCFNLFKYHVAICLKALRMAFIFDIPHEIYSLQPFWQRYLKLAFFYSLGRLIIQSWSKYYMGFLSTTQTS